MKMGNRLASAVTYRIGWIEIKAFAYFLSLSYPKGVLRVMEMLTDFSYSKSLIHNLKPSN